MDIAKKIFNDQNNTSDLIDLFSKRYKIDENSETFQWLCLNKINDYFVFLRICELANRCCVIKNERGFDIRIDAEHNKVLVNDIRNYLLPRKLQDRVDNTNYEFLL